MQPAGCRALAETWTPLYEADHTCAIVCFLPRGGKQLLLPPACVLVAFAGGSLEPVPVQYSDPASLVRDEARLLEDADRHSHSRAPDAKHLRKKTLRELELAAPDPVLRKKKPAGASLLGDVHPVAGGGLTCHFHRELRITQKPAVKNGHFRQRIQESLKRCPQAEPGHLHDGTIV